MSGVAELAAVTLDCPDPRALADFYHKVTGYEIVHSDENFAGLSTGNGLWIGFQRVEGYQSPRWPGQSIPQQFHLDLKVADPATAAAEVEKLGATRADFQPGSDRWLVFLDPAGHPFCLTSAG